ncbi:MAG: pyrimidine 5'-nucleotidase [Sulfurimicrobium sp.]|jgi:putative hydrolase of the HAD superfamily|nr:pyrimidine 5'-nucleotidase [Sulfurimicrobium sp.]MDZ7656439.1 pyrimidine 5'-nucleotidase [Sulfurimicrobium sp.]
MMTSRGGLTWVFDLDNTLHNASPHIFPHLNRAMTQYLQDHLALDEAAADHLRDHYWQRYGATLQGLVRHHGTEPDHFLWHTHQFPELERMVLRERGLRAALKRLRGSKILYTNAPAFYAEAVLRLLRIDDLFTGVFTIEGAYYHPKPDAQGFYRLLRAWRLSPGNCVMVEDTLNNLRTAKRLGMKTVLIGSTPKRVAGVDVSLRSVLELPRAQRKFKKQQGENNGDQTG